MTDEEHALIMKSLIDSGQVLYRIYSPEDWVDPIPGGWQPIETAPHGEPVLLGWWYAGKWENEVAPATTGWQRGGFSTMSQHGQATHWMRLPAPPCRTP